MSNELAKHKYLYKTFLIVTKHLPIILFIIQIISLIYNYMGISIPILISIAGSSIVFMGILLLISYVFRYCYLYRIPIWGNMVIGCLCILRMSGLLPIELINLYRIFGIIASSVITLYVIIAYKTRNNPKIDYLKHLCGCR